MPTSSTVWCWSTSRSPVAFSFKSNAPCLVNSSSMWSKKRMPVEISYRPRPSSFNAPRICVSLVLRWTLADLIDVPEHLDRTFQVQQLQQFVATRAGGRGDSNERHVGSPGTTCIVHRIADVQQLLGRRQRGDLQQSVGRRLLPLDIVGGHKQESVAQAFTIQSDFRLFGGPSGENGELEVRTQPVEQPISRK